jgi:hypothetical protein
VRQFHGLQQEVRDLLTKSTPLMRWFVLSLLTVGGAASQGQQIPSAWNGELSGAPLMHVRAMTMHDFDGSGPRPPSLVICEGDEVWYVVSEYSEGTWREILRVQAFETGIGLASYDTDGPGPALPMLLFHHRPRTSYSNIPRLGRIEGSTILPIGLQNASAVSMIVWDSDGPGPIPSRLIAAGGVQPLNSSSWFGIAAWDGTTWTNLSPNANFDPTTVAIFDPDGEGPGPSTLAVGGNFAASGGQPAGTVAILNGTQWRIVPRAPNESFANFVPARLISHDPDGPGPRLPMLIAGDRQIVAWDGSNWFSLSYGSSLGPVSIASFDPDGGGPAVPQLIAGGRGNALSIWNNQLPPFAPGWISIDTVSHFRWTYELLVHDPDGEGPQAPVLYRASHPRDRPSTIYVWNGAQWRRLTRSALEPLGRILTHDPDGPGPIPRTLYATRIVDNTPRLRQWNGLDWADVSLLRNIRADSLFAFDIDGTQQLGEELLVAYFEPADSNNGLQVARIDGRRIVLLGTPFPNSPPVLGSHDPDGPGIEKALPVIGIRNYLEVTDAPTEQLLDAVQLFRDGRWVRHQTHLPTVGAFVGLDIPSRFFSCDLDGSPDTEQDLIVSGTFRRFDKTAESAIAIWRGDRWERVGSPFVGALRGLVHFDLDGDGPLPRQLIGVFGSTSTSSQVTGRIVALTDNTWLPISGTNPQSQPTDVRQMIIFDPDGPGPARPELRVIGTLSNSSDLFIFRWNNAAWEMIGDSLEASVISGLISFDPDEQGPIPPHLVAIGSFNRAGSFRSPFVAAFGPVGSWKASLPSLDFYPDGIFSPLDLEYFQRYFAADNPIADVGGEGGLLGPDGQLDSNDWIAFIRRYLLTIH